MTYRYKLSLGNLHNRGLYKITITRENIFFDFTIIICLLLSPKLDNGVDSLRFILIIFFLAIGNFTLL